MPTVLHRQIKSFSGPVIKGTVEIELPSGDRQSSHVHRAFWLTAKVESGAKLGAVMMADGTAATIGLDQHIAVYPRELANEDYNAADDQGGLWKLLRRLEVVRGTGEYQKHVEHLWRLFADAGWFVAQDGVLRYLADDSVKVGSKTLSVKAGDVVFGAQIRDTLTPPGGKVPKSGPDWERAKEFALALHNVTSHPNSEKAQVEFGCEHLVERTKHRRVKMPDGSWADLEKVGYGNREVSSLRVGPTWPEALDLALCVYQSHSVNAPSVANRILGKAYSESGQDALFFAARLIRLLGNATYGRWDDDIRFGRYQRTRTAARASGLWSRNLFDGAGALMPKDLPEDKDLGVV